MKKKLSTSLFLLAITAASCSRAANLELFTSAKPAAYSSAFPDGTVRPRTYLTSQKLRVFDLSFTGGAPAGGALGVGALDLSPYSESGSLEFYVMGEKGGELAQVGLSPRAAMPADLAQPAGLLPLANFCKVSRTWQKVRIPLKSLPKQAAEFRVYYQGGASERIFFCNIVISGAGAAAAAAAPAGDMMFYQGAFSKSNGAAKAFAGKSSFAPVSPGHSSGSALKIDLLGGGTWSTVFIGRTPVDLRPLQATGQLEVWVKRTKGGEDLWFGLVNPGTHLFTRVNAIRYLNGAANVWEKALIPLSDFDSIGRLPGQAPNAKGQTFDWSQVSEISVDNAGAYQAGSFLVDDISIHR